MKEFRILQFQRVLYNYQAEIYLKKEISISFFIITISASNLYMPMIWSYVFLLDFLIPFLCGPDLQSATLNKATVCIKNSDFQSVDTDSLSAADRESIVNSGQWTALLKNCEA